MAFRPRISVPLAFVVLAGLSTTCAGSPTVHADRKNSSYLHSVQANIGPSAESIGKNLRADTAGAMQLIANLSSTLCSVWVRTGSRN